MIVVTFTYKSTPGNRTKVIENARPCIEATRKEKGCIRYELFASTEDDVTLQFIEEWTDLDCLRAHLKTPHVAALRAGQANYVEQGEIFKIFEAKEISL